MRSAYLPKPRNEPELWCWRRLSRVPWTARRSNQFILKDISPEYPLEGLMLKLKLQYFGHLMQRTDSLEKTDDGKGWRREQKGTTEDEMVGWHHWLNGHEFEQAPGVGDGQGSLACCSPWGHKESDMTEWLNWTSNIMTTKLFTSYGLNCIPSQIHMLKFHFWEPENVTLFENKVWKCCLSTMSNSL